MGGKWHAVIVAMKMIAAFIYMMRFQGNKITFNLTYGSFEIYIIEV